MMLAGRGGSARQTVISLWRFMHTYRISREAFSGRIQHIDRGRTGILRGNSVLKGVLRLWALLANLLEQKKANLIDF